MREREGRLTKAEALHVMAPGWEAVVLKLHKLPHRWPGRCAAWAWMW